MKIKRLGRNNFGFGHIEAFLILIVILAIVGVGTWIYTNKVDVASGATANSNVSVDFFGDSLMQQTSQYLSSDFNTQNTSLSVRAVGGTALCDWVYPNMKTSNTSLTYNTSKLGAIMALNSSNNPNVAVMEFVGDNFTPCAVQAGTFSQTQLVANYQYNLSQALAHLKSIGTKYVILDLGPVTKTPLADRSALTSMINQEISTYNSSSFNVVYASSADASVVNTNGTFAADLPCLATENQFSQCSNVKINGVASNVVRSADGIHFCPVTQGNSLGQVPIYCPAYASGAFRFANAFAQMIWSKYPQTLITQSNMPVVSSISYKTPGSDKGGTAVTINGYNFKYVNSVYFVKLWSNDGGTPTSIDRVPVTSKTTINSSGTQITIAASPALDKTSAADPGNVFVQVTSATQVSTIGLASQLFTSQ